MRLNVVKSVLIIFTTAYSTQGVAAATRFEVAHLAIHRLERLVDLGKLTEDYATAFKSLSIEVLPGPIVAGQPANRLTARQVPHSNGTVKTVQLLSDSDGKPVPNDFKVLEGTLGEKPPVWPDKLATEITEEALHVVEKLKKPEYVVFMNNLSGYSLSQVLGPDGKIRGIVTIEATGTTDTLVATMRANGSADGDPIVKKGP